MSIEDHSSQGLGFDETPLLDDAPFASLCDHIAIELMEVSKDGHGPASTTTRTAITGCLATGRDLAAILDNEGLRPDDHDAATGTAARKLRAAGAAKLQGRQVGIALGNAALGLRRTVAMVGAILPGCLVAAAASIGTLHGPGRPTRAVLFRLARHADAALG